MANNKVDKTYNEELRILETTDPGHADTFNPLFKQLVNNDAYLKEKVDEVMSRTADMPKIVTSDKNIPISQRKKGTIYFIVTDKVLSITNQNVKVSPAMGLKIEK